MQEKKNKIKDVEEKGKKNKYDIIRQILREHSSREKPLSRKDIEEESTKMKYSIGRNAIEHFMGELATEYETDAECDEIIREWPPEKRELILCKVNKEGRQTGTYWMMETLSNAEWNYLLDSVLYSKILTKREADNLAKRICVVAGKQFEDSVKYRERMNGQPYFYEDKYMDKKTEHIESRVLKQVHIIREAIRSEKKVKFTLNVYKYENQKIGLVPIGKEGRICSAYDIVYSNGRYYMLGADINLERSKKIKYLLYRVDLMTDVSITRAPATSREEAGLIEVNDLYRFRMENPYMFAGETKKVKIRIDSQQFTQVVDAFGDDHFRVVGYDANEQSYYDIEMRVNLNSFLFWVLQYSGCVQVLDEAGKRKEGEESFRERVRETLRETLKKYEDPEG